MAKFHIVDKYDFLDATVVDGASMDVDQDSLLRILDDSGEVVHIHREWVSVTYKAD